ncbi:MAG: hypothetical protein OXI66_04825 [Boseongicola sp.]|nr:hypothetical protein [Boseongicola sp.]
MSCPSSSPDPCPLRDRAASLDGGLPVSSAILSRDPETGEYPASREFQEAHCLAHFCNSLNATSVDPQGVARIEMCLQDFGDRSRYYLLWPEMYRGPQHRPVRHAIRSDLPEDCMIQVVATAILPED